MREFYYKWKTSESYGDFEYTKKCVYLHGDIYIGDYKCLNSICFEHINKKLVRCRADELLESNMIYKLLLTEKNKPR